MSDYNVYFYRKEDDSCPVKDFINSLDVKMRTKVMGGVALLKQNGPRLREPYSKPLGDGLFELRTKQGSDITRVLYFFFDGKQIVMTNGFVKKTPKTPPAEIQTAKKYRTDYLSRKEKKSSMILRSCWQNSLKTRSSRLSGMRSSRSLPSPKR